MTEKQASEVLRKYFTKPNLLKHAIAVSAAMKHFAKLEGEDESYWAVVGLLHDIDYEMYPEVHCIKCVEILRKEGLDESIIHAIQSHGCGLCNDVEPTRYMEKVLCTVDQLTGFIIACALIRPERKLSVVDMDSIRKKWGQRAFAAGTSRDRIMAYCEKLGKTFDYMAEQTLIAMQGIATELGL